MMANMDKSFEELGGSILHHPGVPLFKAIELPIQVCDRTEASRTFLLIERIPEPNDILVSTFESLEAQAVRALKDGLYVPSSATSRVYCIGPFCHGRRRQEA